MKDFHRDHPQFSLCGLNCLLCPMNLGGYCPGCGGGAGNQSCAVARCALEQGGVEFCTQCGQFPCARYRKLLEYDSFIPHSRMVRDLERAGELGLLTVTHAGLDVGFPGKVNCSPEMVLRALKQVGPIPLVLAHMGGWRCWDQVEELLSHTGVYLDTAFSLGSMTSNGDGYYRPEDLPQEEADGAFLI